MYQEVIRDAIFNGCYVHPEGNTYALFLHNFLNLS